MYVFRCLDVFGMRWFGNGCETTDMGLSQDENCALEPGTLVEVEAAKLWTACAQRFVSLLKQST